MTEKELQRIKERCEKATPGPWKILNIPYNGYDDPEIVTKDGTYICQTTYDMQSQSEKYNVDEDTEFIAHAREDIPKLIAEIKRLQALKQIGTCKECKWWERAEKDWGFCHSEATSLWKSGEDFGCIHWEKREKKKEE